MDLVIGNIKSKQDIKLFTELAKRLGLKAKELSVEEAEDYALGEAIMEGRKTGYVEEEAIMKTLRNIKSKKQ